MRVYIVIPTFDEARSLPVLVHKIFTLHPDIHIIVVDDNSPDGTGKIADLLSREYPRLDVIHRAQKAGLGTAYVAGFNQALEKGADLIIEMDADASHDPEYLQVLIDASKKSDVVIGSRYVNGVRVEGWKFRRLLLSKFANIFVSFVMVRPIWDFTAGFRCYRRAVLESIDLNTIRSDGYAFQIEMTHQVFSHGFKILEVPIIFRERVHGYSKISRKVVREAFWITLKCRAPLLKILKHLHYLFKGYNEFVKNNS